MTREKIPKEDLIFIDLLNLPPELLLHLILFLDLPQWQALRLSNTRFRFISGELLQTLRITYYHFPHDHRQFCSLVWKHYTTNDQGMYEINHHAIHKE